MFRKRVQTVFIAVLLIIAALALSQAGPLDPPAPPGPTMKTLDEIPPTWSQLLPDNRRWAVVMDGQGVLDKETGLVWERAPKYVIDPAFTWASAIDYCAGMVTGNGYSQRGGWRLPSVAERGSLGMAGQVFVGDMPFDGDCSDGFCVSFIPYWTSTTVASRPSDAWIGNATSPVSTAPKTATIGAWCVRGGYGSDSGR